MGELEERITPTIGAKEGVSHGIVDGRLKPCPNRPNCVSSQEEAGDKQHYTEALTYSGEPVQAREWLEQAIDSMRRVQIAVREANYWCVEFSSALWGFVDDVEFLFDENAKRIEVRSASRVGYSDLGVNRRRIEVIRRRFSGQ